MHKRRNKRHGDTTLLSGPGSVSQALGITTDLSFNDGTVRNYISEAISKLGANNRIDAARIARDKGWL